MAKLRFLQAQTYDAGSDQQKELLEQAVKQFEEIYTEHRRIPGGQHARLFQARCYQELGKISQALGLYDEMLSHPGNDPALMRMQDEALLYRLMCLNHEQRKDYQLVVTEANQWIQEFTKSERNGQRGSSVHMGILWEKVNALEGLAMAEGTQESQKNALLRQALEDLRYLKSRSPEFRERASQKVGIIEAKLNIEGQAPETFAVALGLGQPMIQQLRDLNAELATARESGDEKAVQEVKSRRDALMANAVDILQLALSLADKTTDVKELNRARYMLGVAYLFLDGREYDAAAIGDFLATRYAVADPETARDAAYLAMTAYIDLFNANQSKNPSSADANVDNAETQMVIRMAELITKHWPKDPKAIEAQMRLGDFYNRMSQPIEAAKYFSQIDKAAPQYQDAQIQAGQAYWNAYVQGATSKSAEPADEETTKNWLQQARQHLRESVDAKQKELAEDATPDYGLVAAKLTLAMIYNETGEFTAAVELLSGKPFPVLDQVKTEGARPERGMKSEKFASAAYQQAMRAYVGTRDIERAQSVLQDLESLGSSDVVVNQLVQLGKQLQDEVKRLRSRNDPRLPNVIQSFEEFLNAMYQRKNQTLQSQFWIGLTYFDLGEGLSNGKIPPPPQAVEKFARAAEVFADALARCEADPNLAKPGQISDLRLRLVRALRKQGQFEEAQKLVADILKERPRAIDAQQEAALIFTDWAAADPNRAEQHLNAAIGGVKSSGDGDQTIWGWGMLSQKIMASILGGNKQTDIVESFAESRYWLAVCRRRLAATQSKTDEQVRLLDLAILDINSTVRAGADISQTSRWEDFNTLYSELHKELMRPVTPLKMPQAIVAQSPAEQAEAETGEVETTDRTNAAATVPTATAPAESSNYTMLIAGVMTLGFVVVMGYLMFAGGKKKKRTYR